MANTNVPKHIAKYLQHYTEEEVNHCTYWPSEIVLQHVVVIPAYKETIAFIQRYCLSKLAQQSSLLICVINQPNTDLEQKPQDLLYQNAQSLGCIYWRHANLCLVKIHNSNSFLLLVDRFSQGINKDQGVGLARKIGADIACKLISECKINTRFIASTDADACLPDEYFSKIEHLNKRVKAAHFNFSHRCDDDVVHGANFQYEQALRYFVQGLNFAQSRYAYFSIGSLWVYDVDAYAMVRGFPKRSAGEDFYILNKLAKLGDMAFIPDSTITLEARTSDRVPFGTGPTVQHILELSRSQAAYCYYNPTCFVLLKQCLEAIESVYSYKDNYEQWLLALPSKIGVALTDIKLHEFIQHHKSQKQTQFNKQLFNWFDAFKTLKFIHALRTQGLGDIPLVDALKVSDSWVLGSSE